MPAERTVPRLLPESDEFAAQAAQPAVLATSTAASLGARDPITVIRPDCGLLGCLNRTS